jgi:peptidoglycan hydrolase-like protein with peptidoglycan-binding domain
MKIGFNVWWSWTVLFLLAGAVVVSSSAYAQAPSTSAGSSSASYRMTSPSYVEGGALRTCPLIYRSLSRGATGNDVKSLQEYLHRVGHLSAEATGYFGPLTERAVIALQKEEGINAVGIFGPLTRARVHERCREPVTPPVLPNALLSATPENGSAPLTVTFSTWLSGFRTRDISYVLEYGDGTSETPADCLAPADACIAPGTNIHVYAKEGTYTAVLYRITDVCRGNSLCMAPISREAIGKVTVVAGGEPVACTKEYNPVCGSKPIFCVKAPCNPIEQTYGNLCMLEADGAKFRHKGECGMPSLNQPPVISSLTGPTVLDVGEKGTWYVKAYDPERGPLSYDVSWGDEVRVMEDMMSGSAAPTYRVRQTTTFTHSYQLRGEYTIRVVVRDEEGGSAETTTTVFVDDPFECIAIYEPVCGLPPGCANACPPGMYCTMMCQMPEPVTYKNDCALKAAGATMLHEGVCTVSSGTQPRM